MQGLMTNPNANKSVLATQTIVKPVAVQATCSDNNLNASNENGKLIGLKLLI